VPSTTLSSSHQHSTRCLTQKGNFEEETYLAGFEVGVGAAIYLCLQPSWPSAFQEDGNGLRVGNLIKPCRGFFNEDARNGVTCVSSVSARHDEKQDSDRCGFRPWTRNVDKSLSKVNDNLKQPTLP
jgi:hypothetical protein